MYKKSQKLHYFFTNRKTCPTCLAKRVFSVEVLAQLPNGHFEVLPIDEVTPAIITVRGEFREFPSSSESRPLKFRQHLLLAHNAWCELFQTPLRSYWLLHVPWRANTWTAPVRVILCILLGQSSVPNRFAQNKRLFTITKSTIIGIYCCTAVV